MNCDPSCGPSQCGLPLIVQGADKTLTIRLVGKSTGLPFPLTGATALVAAFLNEDGTTLEKTLGMGVTITNAAAGVFQVDLTAAETALLAAGYNQSYQSMEFKITIAGKVTIVLMKDSIQVAPPLFAFS